MSLSLILLCVLRPLGVSAQQPPAPQPFPRPPQPGAPGPTRPAPGPTTPAPAAPAPAAPSTPAPAPKANDSAPTEELLGVPIYPTAQFIASYDAGRGQRYYLFGSGSSFVELVTYYRNALKQRGELVYEVPATHEFDVGKYNEDTMAFPPGVTIKDYESEVAKGYPNPKPGGTPAFFQTIIQIVPVAR